MAEKGSYCARTIHGDLESELERLRVQAQRGWPSEADVLRRFGVGQGGQMLEIGCGPGFITEKLLEFAPDHEIVALDSDPEQLQRAEVFLGARTSGRVRFVAGDVCTLSFERDTFDSVVVRFVLQHLADPLRALREIHRVLAPGGRVVIIDIDDGVWGLSEPELRGFHGVVGTYGRAQAKRGGDRKIGRRLWRLMSEAGLYELDLQAVMRHSDELGIDAFLPQFHPDLFTPLVDSGMMSKAEQEDFRDAYQEFSHNQDAYMMMLLWAACGRKPLVPAPPVADADARDG